MDTNTTSLARTLLVETGKTVATQAAAILVLAAAGTIVQKVRAKKAQPEN